MRTLQMIKKEALHILHSPESLLLMLLFPLLLMTGCWERPLPSPPSAPWPCRRTRVAVLSDGSPTASLYISSADQSGIRFDEESREERLSQKISSGAASSNMWKSMARTSSSTALTRRAWTP